MSRPPRASRKPGAISPPADSCNHAAHKRQLESSGCSELNVIEQLMVARALPACGRTYRGAGSVAIASAAEAGADVATPPTVIRVAGRVDALSAALDVRPATDEVAHSSVARGRGVERCHARGTAEAAVGRAVVADARPAAIVVSRIAGVAARDPVARGGGMRLCRARSTARAAAVRAVVADARSAAIVLARTTDRAARAQRVAVIQMSGDGVVAHRDGLRAGRVPGRPVTKSHRSEECHAQKERRGRREHGTYPRG